MKIFFSTIFTSIVLFSGAQAEEFTLESFDYPLNTQLNTTTADPANGWTSGWMADSALATALVDSAAVGQGLSSPAFAFRGLVATGNGLRRSGNLANEDSDLYRGLASPIDWSTDSIRYLSALVFWEANHPTGASRLRFSLDGSGSAVFGFAGNNVDSNKLRIYIRNTTGRTVYGDELFEAGKTYLLVAKIQTVATGEDVISVSVFHPSELLPETDPTWDLTASAARSDRSNVFGFDGKTYSNSLLGFDELRMGDSWDEATSSSFALESFDYPNNTPLNQIYSGPVNGWRSGWMADGALTTALDDSVTVSSEELFSGVFASRGLVRTGSSILRSRNLANEDSDIYRSLAKPVNWSTDSVRYLSALVFWERNHPSDASRVRFTLNGEVTAFGLYGNGTDSHKLRIYIRNTYGATIVGDELFDAGKTYMLVAKIQTVASGEDVISVSVFDPGEVLPETEPTWDLTAAAARSDRSDVFGFDGKTYLDSLLGFDELRMGDSWDEVTAAPLVAGPAEESFIYSNGTALNETSADPRKGWSSGWKADQELTTPLGDQVAVVAGSLDSSAFRSMGMLPGGARLQANVGNEFLMWRGLDQPIDWSSDSVTYFRSLVSWQNSQPSRDSRIYFELGNTGTRFGLAGNDVDANNLRLSVDRSSSDRDIGHTAIHPHNRTYILVAKIETVGSGSDRISLALIEPDDSPTGAEPAWQHQVTLERSDITRVLGAGSQLYGASTLNLDELRMGSSWDELNANGHPALTFGPVGYWPMDEGGGRVIHDQSGSENHAEAFNLSWHNGLASFEWDMYQWIEIPHQAAYSSPSFSMGMWVFNALRPDTSREYNVQNAIGVTLMGQPFKTAQVPRKWVFSTSPGVSLRYGLPTNDHASLIQVISGTALDAIGSKAAGVEVQSGVWQHVFYTYNQSGGVGKLYLDGQLAHETSGVNYEAVNTPFTIGGGQWGVNVNPTLSMHGSLRDAVLYDRVLSESEVASICDGSRPGAAFEFPPKTADFQPWPSMAVDDLASVVRDSGRSDYERAMATIELAGRGAEARAIVPDLRDLLHQLGVANGNHIPKVEEIFRNALIHALLSIEPDRPDVAQVLDAAYAQPYVDTLDWQDDLAGSLYATHRQNGNWRAALQLAREHIAAAPALPAVTGFGSMTLEPQLDDIQSRLPLDERYFKQFFNRQNPYYDNHFSEYNTVEVLPDGTAYATVVESVTYQEAYDQWSANLSSYDATVPDPDALWSRAKVIRMHPDGSRDEQILGGDWFIFDVTDAKMFGWAIVRDKDGYLHLVGGMHNSPRRNYYLPGLWQHMGLGSATPHTMYWISAQPDAMDQLEFHGLSDDPRHMPTVRNYMKFAKSPDGTIFTYGRGNAWNYGLARYDADTGVWKDIDGSFTDMMNTAAATNPEWVESLGDTVPGWTAERTWMRGWHPGQYNFNREPRYDLIGGVTFDRSGRLYANLNLFGVGEAGKVQSDSMTVYSDDLGESFYNVTGEALTLPITNSPIPGHDASIERGNSPDFLNVWEKVIDSYQTRPTPAFQPFHDPEIYPQPAAVIDEALDLPNVTWSMSGRAAMRYDGFVAAAGNTDCLQLSTVSGGSTSLSATFAGPGFIDFHYKTATEAGSDVFSFSVNGGVQVSAFGNGDWQIFRQSIPVGTHTVEWKYQKDAANNDPLDAVFLDQFVWTEDPPRDSDGDGITDIFEDYFGTDPMRHSRGIELLGVDHQARTFKFSHPKNANPASGLVGRYRWSSDLQNWYGSGETLNGSTVSFETRTLENGDVEVTATQSGESLKGLFITLLLSRQ